MLHIEEKNKTKPSMVKE